MHLMTYTYIVVMNTADRPIQVGSHYHFIETNPLLRFDRLGSYGMRLNIAAGTSIRFEPGEKRKVQLVEIAGNKVIMGGNGICNGPVDKSPGNMEKLMKKLTSEGFLHEELDLWSPSQKKARILHQANAILDRQLYARMYGPTTGDVIRLADTELFIRVERDLTVYGDECKFGGGKGKW